MVKRIFEMFLNTAVVEAFLQLETDLQEAARKLLYMIRQGEGPRAIAYLTYGGQTEVMFEDEADDIRIFAIITGDSFFVRHVCVGRDTFTLSDDDDLYIPAILM